MNKIIKLLITFLLFLGFLPFGFIFESENNDGFFSDKQFLLIASAKNSDKIVNIKDKKINEALKNVKKSSIEPGFQKNNDFIRNANNLGGSILAIMKNIAIVLLVIFLVYAGAQMIFSLGDNETLLNSSKKSIWYAVIGLFFLIIPGSLYDAFSKKETGDNITGDIGSITDIHSRNIFINTEVFGSVLGNLITFMEILLVGLMVFVLIYAGLKMMMAYGKDEDLTNSKNKMLWSILGLIFLGVFELWKNVLYLGDFKGTGATLFTKLANLAIFFTGPVAIVFLTLAGYYYITSGGNPEKAKKAKNIVLYTLIGTAILLGIYVLFKEIDSAQLF